VPEAAVRVNVLLPLPGDVMLLGAKLAVTPFRSPLTDNATADWNPLSAAVDSLIAVEAPATTVALVILGVSVRPGGITTVNPTGRTTVSPPPEAVTVRLKEPAAVPEAAVSVNVLLPLPGAATLVGAKLAVTPAGSPLTDSATADWNPLSAAADRLIAVEAPAVTVALVALGASVKLGGIATVTLTGWATRTPPPMAVTVRLKEPVAVPEAAASVNVLLPWPGAAMLVGAKLAVTPAGIPLTDNATGDWNPFNAVVDTTIGVDAPGATVALAAPGVSVKLGTGAPSAVPVRRNVFGPRERHVRSSPTWTVRPWLMSSYAAPIVYAGPGWIAGNCCTHSWPSHSQVSRRKS